MLTWPGVHHEKEIWAKKVDTSSELHLYRLRWGEKDGHEFRIALISIYKLRSTKLEALSNGPG